MCCEVISSLVIFAVLGLRLCVVVLKDVINCQVFSFINYKRVFQSASEHAIFIQKVKNFLVRGTAPSPNPIPTRGDTSPAPTPFGAYGVSTLGSLFQNPKHATGLLRDVVFSKSVSCLSFVHNKW